MLVVFAAAVWLTVARYDSPCTPLAPILALLYLCGTIGSYAARWQGRRWQTGLLLGLFLGPIGVIVAASNRIPDGPNGATGQR
jgi:hypothetical protein